MCYATCISEASAGFPESIVTVVRVSAETPDPIVYLLRYYTTINISTLVCLWPGMVCYEGSLGSETASGVTAVSSNDTRN